MEASIWSKRENAEAFLQAYACDNPSGDSILHLAVWKDDLDLVRRLLGAEFPVDLRNDDGKTPLHLAAERGLVDTCELLMANGANVLARQCPPGGGRGGDGDNSSTPLEQQDMPPSPFDLAFSRDHRNLAELFVRQALSMKIDSTQEYDMLQSIAKAFVTERDCALGAFREMGWDIDRKHSRMGRPFLHYVCEQAENPDSVQLLLNSGADATAEDFGGATALHVAAQLGRCADGSVLKCLIAAGARVNARDRAFGGTPLFAAVQGLKVANVRALLEAGADVNYTVRRGDAKRPILHLAAQDGIPELMQLLLDYGANPNTLDEKGAAPSYWAAWNNHVDAVRVLLEGGLDPNYDNGQSLQMAIQKGRLKIVELLVQHGAMVDRRMIYLCRSCPEGDQLPLFELCVKNMTSLDSDDRADETTVTVRPLPVFDIPMLMENRRPNDSKLCSVLLEHGHGEGLADLEDLPRALLICICAEHGFMEAIPRLLQSGRISEAIRRFGFRPFRWTALHVAAWVGNLSLVEDLQSHGWSVMGEDSLGRTALHLSAFRGHVELAQKLLAAHCLADHRDRDWQTPLHYAVSSAGLKDCRLLEYLAAAGCDVVNASASGETALHRAARFNNEQAAAWLLERGSSPSAADRRFDTPLHVAACFNAVPIVRALLSHGAQVNRAAIDGRTPLHCAAQAGAGGSVAALFDAGADPNKVDSRGHTALAAAICWGACELQTIDALFERTETDWEAPRASHLFVTAALAVKSPKRASVLCRVIAAMRTALGERKARRIIKRLMPELVSEIVVCADDADRGSPADVIPLLLDFLPNNGQTRHVVLFHMLVAVIKHGGDDDGHLTRRLLLLDESNVTQAITNDEGLGHLCCRYGRLTQLRVFLGLGLSPLTRSVIDGEACTPEDVAKRFSPGMLPRFRSLIEGMQRLEWICRRDPTIFPLLRRVLNAEHFTREVVDLSGAFKRDLKAVSGRSTSTPS